MKHRPWIRRISDINKLEGFDLFCLLDVHCTSKDFAGNYDKTCKTTFYKCNNAVTIIITSMIHATCSRYLVHTTAHIMTTKYVGDKNVYQLLYLSKL